PRAKDARIIDEKIQHLNTIVEQILAFARTTEPKLAAVSLNALIEELGLLVRHKLKNQNIQLALNLAPTLRLVMGEAGQLEQAFLNLMLNAVEAMPAGGVLSITSHAASVQAGSQATHVVIDFKDTGVGMSDSQRQRAFKSLLTSTKSKGTGLGLAIVA